MPFHNITEKSRIVVQFGTGDVNVSTAINADGEKFVALAQQPPQEIGTPSQFRKEGDECDDYGVGLFFTKSESIDCLIDILTEHKKEKFGV